VVKNYGVNLSAEERWRLSAVSVGIRGG